MWENEQALKTQWNFSTHGAWHAQRWGQWCHWKIWHLHQINPQSRTQTNQKYENSQFLDQTWPKDVTFNKLEEALDAFNNIKLNLGEVAFKFVNINLIKKIDQMICFYAL